MRNTRLVLLSLVAVTAASACTGAETVVRSQAPEVTEVSVERTTSTTEPTTTTEPEPSTTAVPVATTVPVDSPTTTASPTTTSDAGPTTTRAHIAREVIDTAYGPYATAGPLTLHHPVARVERIGFHQANHDGAQDQHPTAEAARPLVLDSRGRYTGPRTAADIVADPGEVVRAPVSGVVNRASAYTLYCDVTDEFLVINPDDAPYLEVKLLHVQGLAVRAGDRVVAAETVVAANAHPLPFESQVDRDTAEPSWPHVHVEIVDPSIPNRPNPGSGSDC